MGRYLDLARNALSDTEETARQPSWSATSLRVEDRFAQSHARLFPLIGRKVRTPAGLGTLVQVFAHRVTVLLDAELSRCAVFRPVEIEPVSWE